MPNEDELKEIMKTYDEVGMTGAMGSMDGTHLQWTVCPYSERSSHVGKEGYATLVYNVAVSHDMRVLSCTRGFPGAQNDKTIVKFDKFATEVRNGWYKDVEYTLKGEDGGDIKETGPWLIVDGGYHNVSGLVFHRICSADCLYLHPARAKFGVPFTSIT
ncbi:unnamed protein product [Ectocarpus sp. CCAP 1310/34]|nr:unnamed protein product [Ectocarpus sp. CCAP 1310/34]